MPNFNGKGPRNAGPMTGFGNGNCGGNGIQRRFAEQTEDNQNMTAPNPAFCRGPRGCGTGPRSGGGRCGQRRRNTGR